MAYDQQLATANLRASFYDSMVKQIAKRLYKFKQVVTVQSTSAWKNFFYREDPTVASGQSGNATKGIPRGAQFPEAVVQWERVQATIEKYGLEQTIPWEDILSNDIDVQSRILYKVAEGVTKAVDDQIFTGLTESLSPTNIQSVTTYARWDESSAAIIDDLMQAKQKIAEYNYPTNNLTLLISPKDHRSLVAYLASKGAQFPQIGNDTTMNGQVGKILGMNIIESNSVTADYAVVVVPQICATWKSLSDLTTTTIEDPYVSAKVRATELGQLLLTDPKAVVLLSNTQA